MEVTFNLTNTAWDDDSVAKNRRDQMDQVIFCVDKETGRQIIEAIFYSTDRVDRACVWLTYENRYLRAGAKAGGYGYHKPSAALSGCFDKMGIQLSEDIHGRGHNAMEDAIEAIALAANKGRAVFTFNKTA